MSIVGILKEFLEVEIKLKFLQVWEGNDFLETELVSYRVQEIMDLEVTGRYLMRYLL